MAWAHLGLLASLVIILVAQRATLVAAASELGAEPLALDALMEGVLNPRIWLFMLVPWMLLRAHMASTMTRSDLVIIRCGSQRGLWRRVLPSMVAQAALAATGVVVATAASAWGLRWTFAWSAYAQADALRSGRALPAHPVMLLTGQVAVSTITLAGIGTFAVLLWSGCLAGSHKGGMFEWVTSTALFVLPIMAFHMGEGLGRLNPALGLDVPGAIATRHVVAMVVWAIAPAISGWALARARDNGPFEPSLLQRRPAAVHGALVLVVLLVSQMHAPGGWRPAVAMTFLGMSEGIGTLRTGVLSAVIFIGYALAYGVSLDRVLAHSVDQRLLRVGNFGHLVFRHALPWLGGALLIPAASMALVAGVGLLRAQDEALLAPAAELLGFQLLVNGGLQCLVYVGGVCLARCVLPSSVTAGVACGLFLAAAMPVRDSSWKPPSLLNSAALAYDGWPACLRAAGELTLALVVLLIALGWALTRQSVLERNLS